MATLTLDCSSAAQECQDDPSEPPQMIEPSWEDLYRLLTAYMRSYIYNSGILSWYGQEQELIDDIVQESIYRTYAYFKKVESSQAPAVVSIYHFSKTVAFRYFQDLRRKDKRLIRPAQAPGYEEKTADTIEILLEEMNRETILNQAARIVADLPKKQQQALLRDLANRLSAPGDESVPLPLEDQVVPLEFIEQVFLRVGIRLADHQASLSPDRAERNRHASSLCIAYRRLRLSYHTTQDGIE